MPHSPYKARRIRRSAVPHAPVIAHQPMRKDLVLAALVGGSLLAIVGLYAATFRYQRAFNQPVAADFPRWTALMDGIVERTQPVVTQVDRLKAAVTAVAEAKRTQAAATELLKQKLEARAAVATETPETP